MVIFGLIVTCDFSHFVLSFKLKNIFPIHIPASKFNIFLKTVLKDCTVTAYLR